jgi:hypothetical protein
MLIQIWLFVFFDFEIQFSYFVCTQIWMYRIASKRFRNQFLSWFFFVWFSSCEINFCLVFEIYKSEFLNLNNSFKTSRSVNLTQKYSCLLLRIIFAKSFVLLELLVKISTFRSRIKMDFEILFLHVYDSKTGMKCCNLLIRNGWTEYFCKLFLQNAIYFSLLIEVSN